MGILEINFPNLNTSFGLKKVILLVGFILILSSCHKDYNADLQGRWQLRYETTNGKTNNIDTIFYSFDNNVLFVQRKMNPIYYAGVFGKFTQADDSLFLDYVDWNNKSLYGRTWNLSDLNTRKLFGIKDSSEHYKIEVLNGTNLQLKSGLRELIFRKF